MVTVFMYPLSAEMPAQVHMCTHLNDRDTYRHDRDNSNGG
jgi:hypothetical protein